MTNRISNSGLFQRMLSSFRMHRSRSLDAQLQLSSGRKISKPSDDPTGTSRLVGLERRLAELARFQSTADRATDLVDAGAAALQDASDVMTEAREFVIQGHNGTLNADDRKSLATQVDLLRKQLLDMGNSKFADSYLFGGAETKRAPFRVESVGGRERVVYSGSAQGVETQVGTDLFVTINSAGSHVFSSSSPSGVELTSLTGVALGSTANQGTGIEYLTLRHDSTDLSDLTAAGLGIVSAGGGANDSFLGEAALVIDDVAGTIQLGSGPVVQLPQPGDPGAADVTLLNESGGELHLDFTGYTGGSYTGTASAAGSISIDGSSFTPIDFAEGDLELIHPGTGNVVHLDLSGVSRAGEELVSYSGSVNAFDVLQGIADDLRNEDIDFDSIRERLNIHLEELDRDQQSILESMVSLGAVSEQVQKNQGRLADVELRLEGLRSEIRDVEFDEAILRMAEAENALQVAQASGIRILQNSLLNFLR